MTHKHLTTLILSWCQNNQEFNKEQSPPGQQVTPKYGYIMNTRLGADLPTNDFTST